MFSRKLATAIAVLPVTLAMAVATPADGPSLKEIMQGLRNDLVKISDGLLTDDFDMMALGASGIAEHPKIPATQIKLVAAELGTEMPSFKQLDTRVHDLSVRIRDAAKDADRDTALLSFQEMTKGCIACHDAYKVRVARVLADTVAPR